MSHILIVDDESSVLRAFSELLSGQGYDVNSAANGLEALAAVAQSPPDLIISDICMPGMDGLEAFRRIRQEHPRLPVIFMTGQSTMDSAIEATKLGAFDYQLKPLDPEEMLKAVERALQGVRLMQRSVELNPSGSAASGDAMIGVSPAMFEVFKAIGRVAATDATVLVRGESGVGKELVARAIYQHSRRVAAPLLIVNCAAIPETLVESELFGHDRGAFTGAVHRRIGKFEQANGGTIFLDEVGELPLAVQAKLLRVLQDRCFERVGGSETVRPDVRILAATNRDLEKGIADGTFREDLYYRLNVVTIKIPPLRERREDVVPLAEYFIRRFAVELGCDPPVLDDDARTALRDDPWSGNVRELEHCIYRAMIFRQGYPIQAADIARAKQAPTAALQSSGELDLQAIVRRYLDSDPGPNAHEAICEQLDRLLIVEALRRCDGNQTRAARLLGLSRPTLHAKMHRHSMHRDNSSGS